MPPEGPAGPADVAPVLTAPRPAGQLPAPDEPRTGADRLRWFFRWEGALVIALLATVVLGALTSKQFLTASNIFSNISLLYGELAIMTLPMTLIILAGEIDLSIASILALSSSLVGYLWSNHWPMPLVLLTVLVVGLACGAFNGILVTRLGLPSLAVTIGTKTLYAGIAEIILGPIDNHQFPVPLHEHRCEPGAAYVRPTLLLRPDLYCAGRHIWRRVAFDTVWAFRGRYRLEQGSGPIRGNPR